MTNRQWETNWQRTQNGRWETRTWDTQEQAVQAAQDWANWGAWNANWQATNPGQDNRPAWTVRNGKRQ